MLSWSSSQLVRNFQFQLQSDRSIYWQLPSICQCEKGFATWDWVNTTFLAASCFIVILESPEDVLKEPPRVVTCCTCEPNVPHEELNRILRLFLQLGVRKVIPLSATWIGNATAWAAAEKSISFPQHVLGDRIAACKDHNLDYGQIQEGKPLQCCSAWKLVSFWACIYFAAPTSNKTPRQLHLPKTSQHIPKYQQAFNQFKPFLWSNPWILYIILLWFTV